MWHSQDFSAKLFFWGNLVYIVGRTKKILVINGILFDLNIVLNV